MDVGNRIKLSVLSTITFVAWIAAATGWVRGVGILWLIYPVVTLVGLRRRSHDGTS